MASVRSAPPRWDGDGMKLVVEMENGPRYASVHKEGCRDCRDPEPMGEVVDRESIGAAVERATGWDDPDDFSVAPCVKFPSPTKESKS